MGARVRHSVRCDRLPKLEKLAAGLAGKSAAVGATGEHAWLAAIHEYGARVPVTPKMRGFFLKKFGVALKKETAYLVIPERSFLRAGFDANEDGLHREAARLLCAAFDGAVQAAEVPAGVGMWLRDKIRAQAAAPGGPPLSPLTVRAKGGSAPLRDTGAMIDGIEFWVEPG